MSQSLAHLIQDTSSQIYPSNSVNVSQEFQPESIVTPLIRNFNLSTAIAGRLALKSRSLLNNEPGPLPADSFINPCELYMPQWNDSSTSPLDNNSASITMENSAQPDLNHQMSLPLPTGVRDNQTNQTIGHLTSATQAASNQVSPLSKPSKTILTDSSINANEWRTDQTHYSPNTTHEEPSPWGDASPSNISSSELQISSISVQNNSRSQKTSTSTDSKNTIPDRSSRVASNRVNISAPLPINSFASSNPISVPNSSWQEVNSSHPPQRFSSAVSSFVEDTGKSALLPSVTSITGAAVRKEGRLTSSAYSSHNKQLNESYFTSSTEGNTHLTTGDTEKKSNVTSLSHEFACEFPEGLNETTTNCSSGYIGSSGVNPISQQSDRTLKSLDPNLKNHGTPKRIAVSQIQPLPVIVDSGSQVKASSTSAEWMEESGGNATQSNYKSTTNRSPQATTETRLPSKPSPSETHLSSGFSNAASGGSTRRPLTLIPINQSLAGTSSENTSKSALKKPATFIPTSSFSSNQSLSTTTSQNIQNSDDAFAAAKSNSSIPQVLPLTLVSSSSTNVSRQGSKELNSLTTFLTNGHSSGNHFSKFHPLTSTNTIHSSAQQAGNRTSVQSLNFTQAHVQATGSLHLNNTRGSIQTNSFNSNLSSTNSTSSTSEKINSHTKNPSSWPKTSTHALHNSNYSTPDTYYQVTKGERITVISVGLGFSIGILLLAVLGGFLKKRSMKKYPPNLDISRPKNRVLGALDENFSDQSNDKDRYAVNSDGLVYGDDEEANVGSRQAFERYIGYASRFGTLEHNGLDDESRPHYPADVPQIPSEHAGARRCESELSSIPMTFQNLRHGESELQGIDQQGVSFPEKTDTSHRRTPGNAEDQQSAFSGLTRFSIANTMNNVPPVPFLKNHER